MSDFSSDDKPVGRPFGGLRQWSGMFALTGFTCWLIAFPMGGFLLPAPNDQGLMLFFVLPHALTLFAIARLMKPERFESLSMGGVGLSILLTAFFPFLSGHVHALLVVLGVAGAFTSLKTCTLLSRSPRPVLSAGLGIAAGNGLVQIFSALSVPSSARFLLASLLLSPVLLTRLAGGPSEKHAARDIRDLRIYAPFIYVFYLTGGLTFCYLVPRYADAAFWGDIALLFYMLLAVAGIPVIKKNPDVALVIGIVLGSLAFALLWSEGPVVLNLGMYLMQASFGLIDLFCISLFLSFGTPLRAFGYGLGVTSLGIASGSFIAVHLKDLTASMIVVGNFATSLSLAIIYLCARKDFQCRIGSTPEEIDASEKGDDPREDGEIGALLATESSNRLEKDFSRRERLVVELVLKGKTYKEVALELGISESSVKTYMRRIYEKRGVYSKDGLIELLRSRRQPGAGANE
ncbi:MAG: LuxR family transcriptional regulator [Acidobacteriota bacterium]